jgi:hypothetical protein
MIKDILILHVNLYNNITRIAIVNAASNITYRPVIEAKYYQESYILSVVTVAEWLDGSFESQSRLEKPNSGSIPESPKICVTRF